MKMPGMIPLAAFLFAVPMLVPVIERFWPTNTTWWSAILVVFLVAVSSALWLVYRRQLAKIDMPAITPAAAPAPGDDDDYTWQAAQPAQAAPTWRKWLLG